MSRTDGEAPVIAQAENLCGGVMTIAKLAAPGFTLPTATDNTGATELSGLSIDFMSSNNDPSIALLESKIYSYSVTDGVGLEDQCLITVNVFG